MLSGVAAAVELNGKSSALQPLPLPYVLVQLCIRTVRVPAQTCRCALQGMLLLAGSTTVYQVLPDAGEKKKQRLQVLQLSTASSGSVAHYRHSHPASTC